MKSAVQTNSTPKLPAFASLQNVSKENLNITDCIKHIGADFKVEKQPLVSLTEDMIAAIQRGEAVIIDPANIITSHAATVRNDNNLPLGIVGKDYGVIQNENAFSFLNFLEEVSEEKVHITNAGMLGDGNKLYIVCELGDGMMLGDNDKVKNYVVFSNAHDGTGALKVFFTPIRMVCSNMMSVALKGAIGQMVFKHTKNVNERVDWNNEINRKKAIEVMLSSSTYKKKWLENMEKLKSQKVTAEEVNDFVAQLYFTDDVYKTYKESKQSWDLIDDISTRAKNQANALVNSIENGIGQADYRGTKLWLLNGLTTHIQNEQNWKDDDTKFNSMMSGTEYNRLQKAHSILAFAA